MKDARRRMVLWALCAAATATAVCLGIAMIRDSAPTFDEPAHLAAGYLSLTTSIRHIMARDHGPAAQMWDALPLLALKPATLLGDASWGHLFQYGETFLYKNTRPADRMLDAARVWSLVSWTSLLSLALLSWALDLGGLTAAAFSGLLLAFCPLWISNAALVTTDAGATLFFFATFWILASSPRSNGRWLAAGACLGLAMTSKLSMGLAPPLAGAAWLLEPMPSAQRRLELPGLFLLIAAALAVICACYHGHPSLYFERLSATFSGLRIDRPAFLWGHYSRNGWPWYFPFALAVKSPIPLLIAAAAGFVEFPSIAPRRQRSWLLLAPIAYFAAACASKTQIGCRHLLPILPFLLVLGGCAAARAWRRSGGPRAVVLLLGAWLAAGVIGAGPDYLAYFNEAAGGAAGGWKLLADSNIDWGQALKPLAAELQRRGNPTVYLCYFGAGSPTFYGIRYIPVGVVVDVLGNGRRDRIEGGGPILLAVSQTNLQAVYYDDKRVFGWLRSRRPDFIVGHAIFVYDLTADPDGRRRLAALIGPAGPLGSSITSTL